MAKRIVDKVKMAIDTFIERQPKATLRTMKNIVSEFDGIPTNIVDPETGNLNFDILGRLIAIGVQQVDHSITLEDVEDNIDMDNLHGAMQAATNFITMTLPPGLVPDEMLEVEESEGEDSESEVKN
jgi:hypothetical protein